MEYGAKWIRENLGISRDELRSYEKAGLIPIKKDGCFYRTYNDNEIERIWYIRVFKGMGYTLKELREIAENDDFDYGPTIEDKIKELEYKKSQIEKHIGLANYIKLTGRFPSRPKKIGDSGQSGVDSSLGSLLGQTGLLGDGIDQFGFIHG